MSEKTIACGLDIGSTKVITCVGRFEDGVVDIIGVGAANNQGLRKGEIVDIEETVSAISASLEEAERMSGIPLRSATVGTDGTHINSVESKGVIAVSRPDEEITTEEAARAIEAARAVPNQTNREVLHALAREFIIDGQGGIKDPVGMSGTRLEVDATIISTSINAKKNLIKCVNQSGLEISDVVFSPLATSKILLSKRQKEIGVILVDIGSASTSYAVFEEGELVASGVIPVGSSHITNDIAIGLRTKIDIAEVLKVKYGFAIADKVGEKEEIEVKNIDKNEDGTVSLKYVSEIIEARLNEIFSIIEEHLQVIGRDGTLPAGIILTGGGSKLEGIVELAKESLRLPAQVGTPLIEVSGLVDKLDDPIYSTSIGLMLWDREAGRSAYFDAGDPMSGIFKKAKDLFKQFLP